MKQLTKIRLVNWHLFNNATITCQGTTYFIGVNGVGKSTILDAIQFALVGGQRDVKFNRAAMSGSRRTLTGYVRGELGTEGRRFLRNDATAVVALEFKNPDGSYFVHGGVIDAYQDGRAPDVAYFIVHNAQLSDAWFFQSEGRLFDSRSFRRHMAHAALPGPNAQAQIFTRLEDYRYHLLNRLGQLKETFAAKIVKGLAFSPLTNIRDFVHNYLLEENLVDVKNLREQLETMRHFETLAAGVRQRIEALGKIEELDQERQTQRRLRLTNGYIRRRAQSDVHLADLTERRLELDQSRIDLQRLELRRDTRRASHTHARQALVDAEVALRSDDTARRAQELARQIEQLAARIAPLQQQQTDARQALAREQTDAHRLLALLAKDGQPAPPALQTFAAANLKESPALPPSLTADLQNLSRQYAAQSTRLTDQSHSLREEAARMQHEINSLRTGNRAAGYQSEAPQSAQLRQLLRAELGLSAEEVVPLYEVLSIPNERWQNAVEGILGRTRFDLLVPPQHYNAAMQVYRKHRLSHNLHGVGLPDTERILQNSRTGPDPAANSLAAEVQTDHPAARAFIDLLLGGLVKCDAIEDMRPHRTAVTPDCFVRRNFTNRHLNPRHYRRWFIGERAAPRQIEQREERLTAIAAELQSLHTQKNALDTRLELTAGKVRPLIQLEQTLPLLLQLPQLLTQQSQLQAELDALDTQSVAKLKVDVETRGAEVERLQKELDTLGEQVGGLKNRLEQLSAETIPHLEKQAAEMLQEAQAFLLLEDAEALLEAVQTEYQRRLDRQPVLTIFENATRYENDYQTGENGSRKRLFEAKQSYSLTYQFGYDDREDAARYLIERARFIESELPKYESNIAEQRRLAEQELVENFIHRLREQIEEARQQLNYLNNTLSALRFGGERFEFITKPEPSLRQVYNMIMDSQAVLGESLFDSDFRQRHQQGWDMLFERLTAAHDEELTELRELQDYRNYLQYDIRVHYPDGDRALLSQINAKKSGGETTTPFYVAMAASFAQAYRLNQPRASDTIRLAMFDEAFGKMDTARTASALKFMVDNNLQVLLATPPDKAAGLLEHVDSVRTVLRKGNNAFVIEMDKNAALQQVEA